MLAKGQVKRGLVATIPEGWRTEQIADRLETTGVSSREEFLSAVSAPASVPGVNVLGEPAPRRLEGYLFPETYEVSAAGAGHARRRIDGAHVPAARRRGAAQRQRHVAHAAARCVTLASIVEREAKQPSERPTIASVYLNRLAAGLPLQADPTVQYAVATRDGAQAAAYNYWKTDADGRPICRSSRRTTRICTMACRPGPICNPGEASIRAVLQPAQTDYLYFVANTDGSGTHLFARTLDEHNANVAKVNRRDERAPLEPPRCYTSVLIPHAVAHLLCLARGHRPRRSNGGSPQDQCLPLSR